AHDGSILLDPDGTGPAAPSGITYTGLEPLTNTGTASVAIFNLPTDGQDNQAFLEDNGDLNDGMVRLRSGNGTFETTVFANPTGDTRIQASNDGETLELHQLDNNYLAFVDYFGGTGNDTFALDFRGGTNILPTAGPNQVAFVGGAGTDQLRILDDTGGYVAGDVTYSYHIIQGMDLGAQAGTHSIDENG